MYKIKYYTKTEKKTPSKLLFLFKKTILIVVLIFLSNFIFNIYFYKVDLNKAVFINPLAKEIIHNASTFINSRQNSVGLEKIVQNILGKENENFAIVIFNIETGERYYLNEEKTFDTASLYKLWVMAVSFQQIELGFLNQTDVLSDSISSLDKKFNLTTNEKEAGDQVISWPVENALENMITISDNYSAYLLTQKIGIQKISDFLSKQGFSESKVGTTNSGPKTSASDMAIFLERLVNGRFGNQEDTETMVKLLKSQKVNTKLTKYLPSTVVIAHKTGELGSFSHDVGIAYLPNGNYIFVAMSKTNDQLDANEKIAKISKEVYEYFLKK